MDDALNDSIQKSLEYSEDSENLPLKGDDHTEPGPDDDLDPKVGLSDDSDYDSDEAAAEEKLQAAWEAGQFGTEDVPLGGHNFCRDVRFLDGKKRMEEDLIRAQIEKDQEERRREAEEAAKGDGEKTRKRRRRAIQAARKKALQSERPEIRQLLSRQKWVPKKCDNGWWLKDGLWLGLFPLKGSSGYLKL